MDFPCMNRKQLQALCKQHGVPANLSNREMADRLSLILKEKKAVSSKKSSKKMKASMKKSSEKVSKVVKKVRFSPENETFLYEVSGCRRLTRRRATLISLSKKQSQVVENEVSSSPSVGRKRARRDVQEGSMEVKSAVECDDNGNGGLVRGQLRSRGLRVERDLVVSRKITTRRSSKIIKNENEVFEDNDVGEEDFERISKVGVRNTRSRAKFAIDGTESSRSLRQKKRSVTEDEGSEMLSGNSGQVNNRITRSRAKVAGNLSAVESKTGENHQLEEPSKVLGRFASRRKSVVVEKGKAQSDEIPDKKQVRKRSRNNAVEGALELEATVEPSKESEDVKKILPGPSRRSRRNISTVSTDGELEADENVGQKNFFLTEKPLRRSSRNVVDGAELEKVLQEQDAEKDEDSEISSRNCKRFKIINRITRSQSKSAGEASAEESDTVMIKSTSIDKELKAHKNFGQADASFAKDDTKSSNRNASTNHSTDTSSKVRGISRDGELVRPQKRRQKQIQDEDSSMNKGKTLAEKPLRRSARNTSKVNLVEPSGPTGEIVRKMHHSTSRMPCVVEDVPSSDNLSATEEPHIVDARLAGSESRGITKNLEANRSEQILGSSNKKRKTYKGKFSKKNQLNSVEDSTINSEIEKTEDTVVNIDLEDIKINNNVGKLTSSEMADGHSPAIQSDDLAEPSNIADMGKEPEAEEQSIGKNKNHGSDNVYDHWKKGDGTLVQEFDNLLQLEHAKEAIVEPVIQEAILEEHLNEPGGSSSEKNPEISQDEAEEINKIDTSVGEGTSHSENFPGAIQLEDLTAESQLVTAETGSARTIETQSISGGTNGTEATPCKSTLESEGFDNKVNNSPAHVLLASNDAWTEVNKCEIHNVLKSTMLENQLNSVEESPINSETAKTEDTTVNNDPEDIKINNNVGNLTSSEMADGHSPAIQSDDLDEPSNIAEMGNVTEAEEQSIGENKNHGVDDMDDHSRKGEGTLVQEFDNRLQLEDAKETIAEPVIQEAFFEEHLNEPSGSSSEKNPEISQDEAEEINAIDTSVGEGTSHSENFLGAIQLEELSHLITVETGSVRTTEIQSISGGTNVTEATPCKPTLESEEVYKGETQNALQSTMLERCNKNCVGQGEFSAKGVEFSNGIICRGETSVSNASNGICSLAKTAEYVTTDKSEPEEAFHNEKASQVGEKSRTKGYEENLVLASCSIPFSAETDCNDAQNKENEVLAECSRVAVKQENEVLEQKSGSVSEESSGNSMHEISEAKETKKGADVQQNTLVASINLPSPGAVDKGSLSNELALPKSNDKLGKDSIIGTKSSCLNGKRSMYSDKQEKSKAKLNEDTKGGLNIEVQAESLTRLALEKWQDGMEDDTPYADSTSGKLLCQLTADCDLVKRMELQVSDDCSSGKAFPLDKSAAVNGTELVREIVHDHANLEGKSNCIADIIVEHYAIIVEENAEDALNIDLGEKSDQKEVGSQVNDTDSRSMTGIISKEIEVLNEIAIDTMIKAAECADGDDNLKLEESRADNKNSDSEAADASALAQVISNHLVQEDAMGRHDFSTGSTGFAAEGKTKTVAIERIDFLGTAENGETMVTDSPVIPGRTFKGEFEENNSPAPGFLNEVISANCEDLGKRPNEVVGTVAHDEAKSGDLDNFTEENILELGQSASVTSDNLIAVNGRAPTEKENVGAVVGTLSFKDNKSNAEKEDNVDTIAEVTKNDNDNHLLQVGLGSANENDNLFLNYASLNIRVAADDVGDTSMKAEICSQNIEDKTECFEKTPTSSQKIKSGRKLGEKNSAEGKFCADTSFDEPEMSSSIAISHPNLMPFTGSDDMSLRDQKDGECSKDSIHVFHMKDNARTAIELVDDCKVAVAETGFINGSDCMTSREDSYSNKRESTAKVAEEGVLSEKHCDMAVIADIEKFCAASLLTPRMSADCSGFSPTIAHSDHGVTENRSLEFHVDSPQLTSWEMNRIFGSGDQVDVEERTGVISEANLMTQDDEDAVKKESLMTNEQVDQQATGKQQGEQEHHTHLALSDEPNYDHESSEKNELSAINQENIDCDIHKDISHASLEKVVLTEVAASSERRTPQELPEEQVDKREGATIEATFVDSVNYLSLNQLSCGSKRKQLALETVEEVDLENLHCLDDEVVTANDSKEDVDLENLNVAYISESEMAFDRSTFSPVSASSDSGQKGLESDVESHISTAPELNASEPCEQGKIEYSDVGAFKTANMANEDAREVKVEEVTTEKVTPQVTEEQLHEHEMAEEVSELKSIHPSDPNEPTCESDKGLTEQQAALAIIHRTSGEKNHKNESSKFDSTNSATVGDTAAEGPWRMELSLLSPPNKSPVAKTGVKTLLAKRLNSSMRKQNNRSTLMQRTPVQLAHDMKENVLNSTKKGKAGKFTAQKAFSNRLALQDLHKK